MIVTAINSFTLKDNVAPYFVARRSAATIPRASSLRDLVAGVLSPRFMNKMTMLTNGSAGMEPPRRMKGIDETRKEAASGGWFSFGDQ
jgi:hypothetical protein